MPSRKAAGDSRQFAKATPALFGLAAFGLRCKFCGNCDIRLFQRALLAIALFRDKRFCRPCLGGVQRYLLAVFQRLVLGFFTLQSFLLQTKGGRNLHALTLHIFKARHHTAFVGRG
jgi:hypothetical protein